MKLKRRCLKYFGNNYQNKIKKKKFLQQVKLGKMNYRVQLFKKKMQLLIKNLILIKKIVI